jgi:hypothetical protein
VEVTETLYGDCPVAVSQLVTKGAVYDDTSPLMVAGVTPSAWVTGIAR